MTQQRPLLATEYATLIPTEQMPNKQEADLGVGSYECLFLIAKVTLNDGFISITLICFFDLILL